MALDDILVLEDFEAWNLSDTERLDQLIGDVLAQAAIVAPCLDAPAFAYGRAAKAVLREAVLRRLDAGTGAVTTRQQGTGPFSQMEVVDARGMRGILRPDDISQLQTLCSLHNDETESGRLSYIDLTPDRGNAPSLVDRPDLWFQINVPWETP